MLLKISGLSTTDIEVSVDVAWSPDNIDGRGYDYAALARYADQGEAESVCVSLSLSVSVRHELRRAESDVGRGEV